MNRNDLRRLDMNLLVIFEALMFEKNLMRVADDLARVGRSRRAILPVPQFSGLRSLLPGTEMLATVPDYAACTLVDGCNLRADDPPFPNVPSELSMVWNGVNDNDPAERWLRSRIAEHMSTPLPPEAHSQAGD